jgi:hypothetical protein
VIIWAGDGIVAFLNSSVDEIYETCKITNKRQSEVVQRKDMKTFNGLKAILD